MLADAGNVQDWADAILRVIEDRELRDAISKRAKEDIYDKYNWHDRATRIFSI